MEVLSVRITKKIKDELTRAAANKGIMPSQFVRIALCKALKIRLKDMNNGK